MLDFKSLDDVIDLFIPYIFYHTEHQEFFKPKLFHDTQYNRIYTENPI